ncbi:Y-family DNA polymerase [Nostoc sp.]|uniref:Y-family DNA polymerase n=1 Tax=Nostoc sp. TaxID=1180 RepID=UPI003FA5D1E1
MDAFYASVEQRDNPSYRGKPLVVGGSPNQRGVVAAASYEARKFGIHSAMPSVTAIAKCPELIFVRPRFDIYREISTSIHAIFKRYSDLVEGVALDEAYLDVTENKQNIPYASTIARHIYVSLIAYLILQLLSIPEQWRHTLLYKFCYLQPCMCQKISYVHWFEEMMLC